MEAEMEDFETIALGLKNPAAKAQKRNLGHVPLSNAEMALVATLPDSPLYNVELRIMEGIIETLETRSEEHTSELQSHVNLVCRLLLEKKKKKKTNKQKYKQI